jgi:hypothetical protein
VTHFEKKSKSVGSICLWNFKERGSNEKDHEILEGTFIKKIDISETKDNGVKILKLGLSG